jgi:sulfatase maturation enzyme AslB (radical SAM superfamily)
MDGIISAWGKILRGIKPNLSIELTRECPLRCPGCYAYGDNHLEGDVTLRSLADFKGEELVARVKALVERHDPLHLSIIGGEPLVRYRELGEILPWLAARGVYTNLVTSAVRPIPLEWAGLDRLLIAVSVDGLQPEHDARRAPATYDRILKHVAGHQVTVHCTVTRQQAQRAGYVEEFVEFWSAQEATRRIWFSLYTPQIGEVSDERLSDEDRRHVAAEILSLGPRYSKLEASRRMVLEGLLDPPTSPDACIFARTTHCLSADLQTIVTPCQLGGTPECSDCGCLAASALTAVGRYRLPGGIPVSRMLDWSEAVGRRIGRLRAFGNRKVDAPAPRTIPVRAVTD